MRAYNPLSVAELGRNAVRALMEYPIAVLPPDPPFAGAGVYTVHYAGTFRPYKRLETPIYVGKADKALHSRLSDHAKSIDQADNCHRRFRLPMACSRTGLDRAYGTNPD